MGVAAYAVIGSGGEWRIRHDGKNENVYQTKESAFEAAVTSGLRDIKVRAEQEGNTRRRVRHQLSLIARAASGIFGGWKRRAAEFWLF